MLSGKVRQNFSDNFNIYRYLKISYTCRNEKDQSKDFQEFTDWKSYKAFAHGIILGFGSYPMFGFKYFIDQIKVIFMT